MQKTSWGQSSTIFLCIGPFSALSRQTTNWVTLEQACSWSWPARRKYFAKSVFPWNAVNLPWPGWRGGEKSTLVAEQLYKSRNRMECPLREEEPTWRARTAARGSERKIRVVNVKGTETRPESNRELRRSLYLGGRSETIWRRSCLYKSKRYFKV